MEIMKATNYNYELYIVQTVQYTCRVVKHGVGMDERFPKEAKGEIR